MTMLICPALARKDNFGANSAPKLLAYNESYYLD